MKKLGNTWTPTLLAILVSGCIPAAKAEDPTPPPVEAYQPNFEYALPANAPKVNMTLGLVKPEFGESGLLYHKANLEDEVVGLMIRKMDGTFQELINAKGFSVRGPWKSLNEIAYVDKTGSELVLVPHFDFQVQVTMTNVRQVPLENKGGLGSMFGGGFSGTSTDKNAGSTAGPTESACDVVLSTAGKVEFKAIEPVTREQLWFKSVDVDAAKQTFGAQRGDVCDGKGWTAEVKNAWAKAHEAVFQTSMRALDQYLTSEELLTYKDTIVDLKERKRY